MDRLNKEYPNYAILRGREVIVIKDFMEWAKVFENDQRIIMQTTKKDVMVSTVFLGLNHCFYPGAGDLWFETMVFGGILDGEQDRYETYEQAEAGHKRMCKSVFGEE